MMTVGDKKLSLLLYPIFRLGHLLSVMVAGLVLLLQAVFLWSLGYGFQFPLLSHAPPSRPSRPLPWGDLNVLHTTDIHGWIRGHSLSKDPPEINYSGRLSDLRAFVDHIKEEAASNSRGFLLVDTGDHHDGNAIADLDEPRGHQSLEILAKVPFDILTVGNHELYNYSTALDTRSTLISAFPDRYLTSNVDILIPSIHHDAIPLGAKYRRFKTSSQPKTVTAFGFLFDFRLQAPGIFVRPVHEVVKEPWFLYAASLPTDAFVITGHMAVKDDDWQILYDALREINGNAPIMMFGGHAHVRDCRQFEKDAMLMGSGRYLETVGWMSMKSESAGKRYLFDRRYLDNNIVTYHHHTKTNASTFMTGPALEIDEAIDRLADSFNLSVVLGHVPQTYYLARYPFNHPSSIVNLYISKIMPWYHAQLSSQGLGRGSPFFLVNTGAFRFDLYKGPFTLESKYMVLPFENYLRYIRNVPLSDAQLLLTHLNEVGETHAVTEDEECVLEHRRQCADAYGYWLSTQQDGEGLSEGYVTRDKCPGPGDDVVHRPVKTHELPPFAAASPSQGETVDIVFFDYITLMVLDGLEAVTGRRMDWYDTHPWGSLGAAGLLEEYAKNEW